MKDEKEKDFDSMDRSDCRKFSKKKGGKILFFINLIFLICLACFSLFVGKLPIVSGNSMEPNYHDGEILFTNNIKKDVSINRGDVVIAKASDGLVIIKRVIGLPGETVSCGENGEVLVDGKVIDRSYSAGDVETYFLPTTCDDNEYFLMGDNTNHSSDSRYYGTFKRSSLMGIVRFKVYSKGK